MRGNFGTLTGRRAPFEPIRTFSDLQENLGSRVMAGFGGVAEYGITVRWDKNFLKVIRLLLERRAQFAMFGGVRFGGTLTLDQAFEMGFDHVALALGAGKPTLLDLPNGLARGVRMASDFLMALQLTGAAKTDSIANLQLRLPAVVIENGSIQAPEPLYWWMAQALVRAGYVVLTFDPRGQGRSDLMTPSGEQGSNFNSAVFWTGLVNVIDFFRSTPVMPAHAMPPRTPASRIGTTI